MLVVYYIILYYIILYYIILYTFSKQLDKTLDTEELYICKTYINQYMLELHDYNLTILLHFIKNFCHCVFQYIFTCMYHIYMYVYTYI